LQFADGEFLHHELASDREVLAEHVGQKTQDEDDREEAPPNGNY
jgi:hypothetical protein